MKKIQNLKKKPIINKRKKLNREKSNRLQTKEDNTSLNEGNQLEIKQLILKKQSPLFKQNEHNLIEKSRKLKYNSLSNDKIFKRLNNEKKVGEVLKPVKIESVKKFITNDIEERKEDFFFEKKKPEFRKFKKSNTKTSLSRFIHRNHFKFEKLNENINTQLIKFHMGKKFSFKPELKVIKRSNINLIPSFQDSEKNDKNILRNRGISMNSDDNTGVRKESKKEIKEKSRKKDNIKKKSNEFGDIQDNGEDDLFNKIFHSNIQGFPKVLDSEGPYLILVGVRKNIKVTDTLQILLKKIYRNVVGGKPDPENIGDKEDLRDNGAKAGRNIILLNEELFKQKTYENYKDPLNIKTNLLDEEWILKKLDENYSQSFGFLILEVPFDILVKAYKSLTKNIRKIKPSRIILLRPLNKYTLEELNLTTNELEGKTDKKDPITKIRNFSKALHGFIVPKEDKKWQKGKTFDDIFLSCRNEEDLFKKKLKEKFSIKVNGKNIPIERLVKISPREKLKDFKKESELHFFLKTILVRYYYEIKCLELDQVKTEYETPLANDSDNEIIPDIEIKEKNKVIEVETLYGTVNPIGKITETIEKYKKRKFYKINVILTNYDMFFYYKFIKNIKEFYNKEGYKIDFMTFNFSKRKIDLIGINEFKKKFNNDNELK